MRRIFVVDGRLRTVFRILIFLVLFQIAQIAAMGLQPDRAAPASTLYLFAIFYALVVAPPQVRAQRSMSS